MSVELHQHINTHFVQTYIHAFISTKILIEIASIKSSELESGMGTRDEYMKICNNQHGALDERKKSAYHGIF